MRGICDALLLDFRILHRLNISFWFLIYIQFYCYRFRDALLLNDSLLNWHPLSHLGEIRGFSLYWRLVWADRDHYSWRSFRSSWPLLGSLWCDGTQWIWNFRGILCTLNIPLEYDDSSLHLTHASFILLRSWLLSVRTCKCLVAFHSNSINRRGGRCLVSALGRLAAVCDSHNLGRGRDCLFYCGISFFIGQRRLMEEGVFYLGHIIKANKDRLRFEIWRRRGLKFIGLRFERRMFGLWCRYWHMMIRSLLPCEVFRGQTTLLKEIQFSCWALETGHMIISCCNRCMMKRVLHQLSRIIICVTFFYGLMWRWISIVRILILNQHKFILT